MNRVQIQWSSLTVCVW